MYWVLRMSGIISTVCHYYNTVCGGSGIGRVSRHCSKVGNEIRLQIACIERKLVRQIKIYYEVDVMPSRCECEITRT